MLLFHPSPTGRVNTRPFAFPLCLFSFDASSTVGPRFLARSIRRLLQSLLRECSFLLSMLFWLLARFSFQDRRFAVISPLSELRLPRRCCGFCGDISQVVPRCFSSHGGSRWDEKMRVLAFSVAFSVTYLDFFESGLIIGRSTSTCSMRLGPYKVKRI